MGLNNEDIKQLIAILQRGLADDKENTDIDKPKNKPKNNIKTKKIKITDQEDNENKFISMGFHNLHKEDIQIDKMLQKNPLTPRNRTFNKVDVRCRVCGKS